MLERPATQFQIFRSVAVGDNQGGGIGAMQLAGSRIRGVIVDNPSGSWVKLDGPGLGFQPYIAPYTLAWSVSVLPSIQELSAAYVTGPTGQPSSTAGAPIVVYLFESQVPSSGGSQFVAQTGTTQIATQTVTLSPAVVAIADLIVAPPNQRIRITYAELSYATMTRSADMAVQLALFYQLTPGTYVGAFGLTTLDISPERPYADMAVGGSGFAPDPGCSIGFRGLTAFGKIDASVRAHYEVV